MPYVIELVVTALVAMAALSDLGSRTIPNWITLPGLICGFALQSWYRGSTGALTSLEGAVFGFVILMFIFIVGGIGAGDVKLFAAVGAFLGPQLLISAFLFTGLLVAIAAAGAAVWRGRIPATLPYGAVIAAGTVVSLVATG
jgi:prepilin peptidase CpaA